MSYPLEGLALVRMASWQGIETDRDYDFVPLRASSAKFVPATLDPRFDLASLRSTIEERFDTIPELAIRRSVLDQFLDQ